MAAFKANEVERLRMFLQDRLPEGLTASFGFPYNFGRSIAVAVLDGDRPMGHYHFGWMGRDEGHIGYHGPFLTEKAMEGIAMIFTGWVPPADRPAEE